MKDPRITVTVTPELVAELLNADSALKRSRMAPERKHAPGLHALIVQAVSARSKVPVVAGQLVLQPPAATSLTGPDDEPTP